MQGPLKQREYCGRISTARSARPRLRSFVARSLMLLLLASAFAAFGSAPILAQPVVTFVAPAGGPVAGGTPVTISGTAFTGVTAVTFGGIPAASFVFINPTTITAVTPAHAAGPVDVNVTAPSGTGTGTNLYLYAAAPIVTGGSPGGGPIAGGTAVTISGTNFTGTTSVLFDGTAAISFSVVNSTTITALAPAHAFGPVDVTVVAFGGSGTGSGVYTYVAPPTVASVAPNTGPTAGGQSVTISGANFTGASSVTFGGTAATAVVVVNGSTITATTPAHAAGVVDIVVTSFGGIGTGAAIYTYAPPPTVTSVAPAGGPVAGGTAVTITGTNLTGATSVTFGGVAATSVVVINATTITAVTPAHAAGPVDVTVIAPSGSGTGTGVYTYGGTPTVTIVSPAGGPIAGGTAVTITGTGFTGATSVLFDGTAAITFNVVNSTTITATAPAHAFGPVDVTVVAFGGSGTGAGLYTYVAPPTVANVSPNIGPTIGGQSVTITGTNFTGASSVTFGGAAATAIVVVNASTITATTPAHVAGLVDIIVTSFGGIGTGAAIYTYAPLPTVTSVAPAGGPVAGGTAVTITGTNLTGATVVTFGGAAATAVVAVNATTITAVTPAHAAGLVNVSVTVPAGTGTGTGLYTYGAAPTVTSVAPAGGPIAGSTAVTITGTGFTGTTSVTFGGVAATGVLIVNATTITATTPAHAAGAVDIVVTAFGGSGTGVGLYTYVAPPTVASVSPNIGPTTGGQSVTITGTNFTGASSVTFGGAAATAIVVVNATTITATAPAHAAGTVDIVVTGFGGSGTGNALFTYAVVPIVTSASPGSGNVAGGTLVTITGANFTGATTVHFGALLAPSMTVVNANTINAMTPAHTAATVHVTVTTPAGAGQGTNIFKFAAAPTVSAASPNSGPTTGGQLVTITGTDFTGASSVTFGGVAATAVTIVNATTITAITPAHAAGVVNIVVVTPSGSGTGAGHYTYAASGAGTLALVVTTNPAKFSNARQAIVYSFKVTNTGAMPISSLAVSDTKAGPIACPVTTLAAGASTTCTGSYTTTGADIMAKRFSSIATARGLAGAVAITSPAITTVVLLDIDAVRQATLKAIRSFMNNRARLIASTEPDTARMHQRLAGSLYGGDNTEPALPDGDAGARLPGGATPPVYKLAEEPRSRGLGLKEGFAAADRTSRMGINPLGFNGNAANGMGQFAFSTSLAKIRQAGETARANQAAIDDEAGMGLGSMPRPQPVRAAPSSFDIWAQGSIYYYEDDDLNVQRQGHASLIFAGADYLIHPAILVGLLVQSDWISERSASLGTSASGNGWMAGPYISIGLTPNLFFDARAAWGKSDNSIDPLGVYTDNFSTDRSLVSAKLTGNWSYGRLWFRPSAEIAYFEETQLSYINELDFDIPEQSISLSRVSVGPEIGYPFGLENGSVLEPHVGVKGVWTLAQNEGPARLDNVGDDDAFQVRLELGVTLTTRSGISMRASGPYDGLGGDRFSAYEAWASISIPLD